MAYIITMISAREFLKEEINLKMYLLPKQEDLIVDIMTRFKDLQETKFKTRKPYEKVHANRQTRRNSM